MKQLYCGDNVTLMRQHLPDECVDLTVTSPPYDNLRTYNGYEWDFESLAKELWRVTKRGGVVVWVVGDATVNGSETGTSFRQALFFMQCGFNMHDTMIWEKPHFANPSSNRCHQIFEYMFVFSKGVPKTFNQIRDVPIKYGKPFGKTSLRKQNGEIVNSETVRESQDEFGGRKNIWKINTVGQESVGKKQAHPAAFSEQLAHDHIVSWSNEWDVVFDPFMGSGTTGVAALQTNRVFIGMDISDEYVQMSRLRIDTSVNKPHALPNSTAKE